MPSTTTMTVRLDAKVKKQLGRLAETSQRTRSFLAAEAITNYVLRESEIVDGIKRGLADAKAGRVIPHDEAMDRIDATIRAIEEKQIK